MRVHVCVHLCVCVCVCVCVCGGDTASWLGVDSGTLLLVKLLAGQVICSEPQSPYLQLGIILRVGRAEGVNMSHIS